MMAAMIPMMTAVASCSGWKRLGMALAAPSIDFDQLQ
jgi:hypothetical protein